MSARRTRPSTGWNMCWTGTWSIAPPPSSGTWRPTVLPQTAYRSKPLVRELISRSKSESRMTSTESKVNPAELRSAFQEYERAVRVRNYKVGCLLAFIFMPAGASLDYFVYHHFAYQGQVLDKVPEFLRLRLLCSLLLGGIWALLQFKPDLKFYRLLGLLVALLPLAFISWMIYD